MTKSNKKKIYIILCVIVLLFSLSITVYFALTKDIAAEVNGEIIYEYQLDNVLSQSADGSLSREFVLENSIEQLIVVQYGKEQGINIDESFFNDYINEYKKEHPDQYKKGIHIYGEEEFHNGLKYHLIYQQTKEKIINEQIKNIAVTDNDLKTFLHEKNITVEITEENYDIIKSKYIEAKSENLFEEWVNQRKVKSKIKYF